MKTKEMEAKEIELWLEKAKGEMQVGTNGEMYFTDKEVVSLLLKYSDITNAKLVEENERLKQSISRHETDYSDLQNRNIYLREKLSEHKHDIEQLQSELSAAKERVNLYKDATNDLCKLLCLGHTKDELLKAIKVLADLNNTNP